MWTFQYNILESIDPVPGLIAVQCEYTIISDQIDGTFTLNENERGFFITLPTLHINNTSNFFPKNLTESDVTFTQFTLA